MSVIFKDIIRSSRFFRIGNLVRETKARVGFGSLSGIFAVRASRRKPVGIPGDLDFVGRDDDDDAVEAPAPIGQHTFFFAARAGIPLHLEDERRLDDGHGRRIARENLVHPLPLRVDDGGMDNRIEVVEPATLKGQLSEMSAVQAAIRGNHVRTEGADNFGVDRLARLHHLAAQLIGFDDVGAQFAQITRNGALAAAQSACESDSKHVE